MPSYLDFNSTKNFRNYILGKTLLSANGPQTQNENSYSYQAQNDYSNIDPGAVDSNREVDLSNGLYVNTYKPNTTQTFIVEDLSDFSRRANLNFYADSSGNPYFTAENHNLISIMSNSNYATESELFKFAANWLRDPNEKGPVYARIQQNLEAATIGRVRLIDALNGNTATAINIITGREPLIEKNYKITVAKTLAGKALDFIQTVAGVEFPFTEIPGDYLSNPRNPVNARPQAQTTTGALLQDITGTLGGLIGVQRRPKLSSKPSDIMVEYMGQGQRQILYDLLSYSRYAPNYTTTARSQQSTKLFSFADNISQGVNRLLGLEAPRGYAYIGDDRGNDVKFAMNDFNERQVRSSYYLSLLFDPIQTELFQRDQNITNFGSIGGVMTWTSNNSKNKLGINNKEYNTQRSRLEESLSTKFGFRRDSILGYTQQLLDSMPSDGALARAHVANAIDQTSRIFRDGDKIMSRGSAIKYVNKQGVESGVEYCRTWTKDRPYMSYSDTMKIGGNIRKYEGSVMTNPWNLNYAPMSNGKKGFDGSSNIFQSSDKNGKSFYAKKYMFSIENLAWKSSTEPGFTVLDLPYCERGPSGGRIMWFPPYALTMNESNAANWEATNFIGRPEPIYTYSNTSRTGTIGFKIVVDHPSILNLLVRDYFKDVSDEEADNYINAFFAGCENLDFYGLIRRYTTLSGDDIRLIQDFLNTNTKTTIIKKFKTVLDPVTQNNEGAISDNANNGSTNSNGTPIDETFNLHFEHDIPTDTGQIITPDDYGQLYDKYIAKTSDYEDGIFYATFDLLAIPPTPSQNESEKLSITTDYERLFKTTNPEGTSTDIATKQKDTITNAFTELTQSYTKYQESLTNLAQAISAQTANNIILTVEASTSSIGKEGKNRKLSLRRSYSVILDILNKIKKPGTVIPAMKWISEADLPKSFTDVVDIAREYSFKEIGYDFDGKINIVSKNYGEQEKTDSGIDKNPDCSNKDFSTYNPKLNIYAPISFGCRKAQVKIEYNVKPQPEPPKLVPPQVVKTKIEEDGEITVESKVKKPPIDVMKRIIMKTLSECYYFKKLEENSPHTFSSLKEKLRYFHPAFHSITPEGLNSRMTFLQQCLRPGNTIPIKGLADTSDINARNTSFGPPPICVLRIGDFYHSKIVIKDVNFTFDETTWDFNPEGIGVQPMIANVTLSINFIGGQGLEKPVEKLQNALSSNFYANTEIYDERAIATNTRIDGKDAEEFTKKFLEELQNYNAAPAEPSNEDKGNKLSEGTYIGELIESTKEISYTKMVDTLRTNIANYFSGFNDMYKVINSTYGAELTNVVLSPTYRTIKTYDVYTNASPTPGTTMDLFGLYKKNRDLSYYVKGLKTKMIAFLETSNPSELLSFDKEITANKISVSNEILQPYLNELIINKLDSLVENSAIKTFEVTRNELISAIDGLNFVVKFGKDAKLTGTDKGIETTLSGFTSADLYKKYEDFIEHIKDNNSKFYEDLNTSIDFNDINITDEIFKNIVSVFMQGETNKLINLYKERDTILFDEKTREKLTKRIDNFIKKPSEVNVKTKKLKDKKDDKEIKFGISSEADITNNDMLIELRKLKINKLDVELFGKINYYKNDIKK